jgi:hypothetical protein
MTDVVRFLVENGLLTPGLIALALGAVAYQLNKSIRELQVEMKALSQQQTQTAIALATAMAILERIDKNGTSAELRHRDLEHGRWESYNSGTKR